MKNCIICSTSTSVKKYCEIDNFTYMKCDNCGFVFLEKSASQSELLDSYLGGPLKKFRRRLLTRFRRFHHFRHFKQHMARTKNVTDFVAQYFPGGGIKFLDIGCNKGFLLANALYRKWEVFGIEFVPEMIAPFKRSYPDVASQIFEGRFEDVQSYLADNTFDAITAIDVIEHVNRPDNDLRNIYRILKPGGILILQTPDSDSMESKENKCNWGALKPMEHLLIFNKINLEKLSSSIGFSKFEIIPNFTHGNGNFSAVLRK